MHRTSASIVLAANNFNLAPILAQTADHKNYSDFDSHGTFIGAVVMKSIEKLEQQK